MRKRTITCSEKCDVWGRSAVALAGVTERDQDAEANTAATKRGSVIISVGNYGLNLLLLFRSQSKRVYLDQNEQ